MQFATSYQQTIAEHRESLKEKEAEQEKEGYKATSRPPRDVDASDDEVRSLLATLLRGP